jgi:hypothetical protein
MSVAFLEEADVKACKGLFRALQDRAEQAKKNGGEKIIDFIAEEVQEIETAFGFEE